MHLKSLISLLFFNVICAQDIYMIRDYFLHKSVSNVAGFSCGSIEDNSRTIRILSEVGISASIKPLGSNINILQFLQTEYWGLGVFLDLSCSDDDTTAIFNKTSTYRMYDHLYYWLILGRTVRHTIEVLNDSAFTIKTDLAISIPRNDGYDLYDAYNHCKLCGGILNITKLGEWRKNGGLNITLTADKFHRRWNYHGMKVKAAGIVLQRPANKDLVEYLQEDNTVIMDNWPKFGYSILVHIAEMFNFTLEIVELQRWEKNDSNGPIMNGLQKRKFDISFYPSILTKERFNYASVIIQVWPIRTCFMFRTIPASKVNMKIILGPFAIESWCMIAVMSIIICLILSIVLKWEKIDASFDYFVPIFLTVGALCQQGLPSFPVKIAGRIAFLIITLFTLLVYNYYSASIVSTRLNAPLERMNDSLYPLIKSDMKLAAERNIFFNFLLRDATDEVQYFKKRWNNIPERKKFLSVEEGVRKMAQGGFAYHADPTDAYPIIARTFSKQMICQLTEVHLLHPSELGFWSTHDAQFLEIAKIGLIRIFTSGIRKRQVLRWSSRKPYCEREKLFVSRVTIREVTPIIIILLCGLILSVILFIMEHFVFHYSRARGENIDGDKQQTYDKSLQQNEPRMLPPRKVKFKQSNLLRDHHNALYK